MHRSWFAEVYGGELRVAGQLEAAWYGCTKCQWAVRFPKYPEYCANYAENNGNHVAELGFTEENGDHVEEFTEICS